MSIFITFNNYIRSSWISLLCFVELLSKWWEKWQQTVEYRAVDNLSTKSYRLRSLMSMFATLAMFANMLVCLPHCGHVCHILILITRLRACLPHFEHDLNTEAQKIWVKLDQVCVCPMQNTVQRQFCRQIKILWPIWHYLIW